MFPLHLAALSGFSDCCRKLLSSGKWSSQTSLFVRACLLVLIRPRPLPVVTVTSSALSSALLIPFVNWFMGCGVSIEQLLPNDGSLLSLAYSARHLTCMFHSFWVLKVIIN